MTSPTPPGRTVLAGSAGVLFWESKDPAEVLDYEFDWSGELNPTNDAIATSAVTVVKGTALIADQNNDTEFLVSLHLTGGTLGEVCEFLCTVTTAAGLTILQSARLKILSKS